MIKLVLETIKKVGYTNFQESGGKVQFFCETKTGSHKVRVQLVCESDHILMLMYTGKVVPLDKRAATALNLAEQNFKLSTNQGCYVIDHDGEVRYLFISSQKLFSSPVRHILVYE